MSTEVRWRRGTAAQHASFAGAPGEITVVTDTNTLRVHDGATLGGHPVTGEVEDIDINGYTNKATLVAADEFLIADSAASYGLKKTTLTTLRANSVNSSVSVYVASSNLTGVIPYDDTVPQSTEGDEILTVALTPSSTTARLRIEFSAWGVHNTNDQSLIAALFMDSETGARRAALAGGGGAAGVPANFHLLYEFAPGDVLSHTFKIRTGIPTASGGASYRLNGSGGARLFGGISAAVLSVQEV
jgi:hypothetical protein